jgi:hypothetical protein
VLLMSNSKHLTHDISNLVSLITKTKLGLSPCSSTLLASFVGREKGGIRGNEILLHLGVHEREMRALIHLGAIGVRLESKFCVLVSQNRIEL